MLIEWGLSVLCVGRCIEQVRSSAYVDISHDLEIDKAIMYLKEKDFGKAAEALKSFEKKDNNKVASTAATNLAFLYYLVCEIDSYKIISGGCKGDG